MKHNLKIFTLLCLAAVMLVFAGCSTGKTETKEPAKDYTLPEAVADVRDQAMDYVQDYAKKLEGSWCDRLETLISRNLGEATMNSSEYAALSATLSGYIKECGATYMYALVPDSEGSYYITVDGSEDPDTWGTSYGSEVQFKEAYEAGLVASARSGWQDGDGKWCWSVFSPLYNSNGNIIAILGIDYPAPVLSEYPEWDRDSESWNGLEK